MNLLPLRVPASSWPIGVLALLGATTLALAGRAAAPAPAAAVSSADAAFFDTRIRPVLSDQCFKCHSHSADRIKGGLMLDSQAGLLQGGNSGPAIVAGKPDESLLIQAIRYTDEELRMPPASHGGKLTDAQIADFEEWVKRGAPDPRVPASASGGAQYAGVGRKHWSFQPLKKPAPPKVESNSWIQSPVDAFVYARLDAAGLRPNPLADKRTLIRRALAATEAAGPAPAFRCRRFGG